MNFNTNKKTTPCRIDKEDVVRQKITKHLEKNYKCKIERVEPTKFTRRKGLPDLNIMMPGCIKMLEVKTHKGRPSAFQKNLIEYIGDHNVCTLIYGYDEDFLDKFIKGELEYE